jgi:hypothetical protein
MYVYNISGDVANIFYQSCALIDNNQQVYEAQIQMPRCKKGIIHKFSLSMLKLFVLADIKGPTS